VTQVALRYFGNSAFEFLTEEEIRIYIDPHIQGNPLCHLSLDDLPPADLILVSHAAQDHMSDVPELAGRFQCPVVCDPGVGFYLKKIGIPEDRIVGMVWGQVWAFRGLKIRALESKHISFLREGPSPITGLPLGFIITTESGFNMYHSGDTSIFSDLKLFGQLYRPDIGLILVGNYPGNLSELSPEEAALAVKWLGLRWAIPMHYEKGSPEPEQFIQAVRRRSPKTKALCMKPGEWKYFKVGKPIHPLRQTSPKLSPKPSRKQ